MDPSPDDSDQNVHPAAEWPEVNDSEQVVHPAPELWPEGDDDSDTIRPPGEDYEWDDMPSEDEAMGVGISGNKMIPLRGRQPASLPI